LALARACNASLLLSFTGPARATATVIATLLAPALGLAHTYSVLAAQRRTATIAAIATATIAAALLAGTTGNAVDALAIQAEFIGLRAILEQIEPGTRRVAGMDR